MVKTGLKTGLKSSIKRTLKKAMIGGAVAMASLLPMKSVNAEDASIEKTSTTLETLTDSPEYCYWYYDNSFNAPNKSKDLTWDTLDTSGERESYTFNKLALDDTSEMTFVKNTWDCTQFALRTMINFFGFPESENQDYNNTIYSMFKTNQGNNSNFNMPVYFVEIRALPDFKHDINGVLIGDNPLNFNDWLFIEPQSDKEIKAGDKNFPLDSVVRIKDIYSYDNLGPSLSTRVKFKLTNGIQISEEHDLGLILNRPTTAVESEKSLDFVLKQNYPNPVNNSTAIDYSLSKPGKVSLDVYNTTGQRIETLVNDFQSTGNHSVNFDASNYPSGNYVYKLRTGNTIETKKMMIVK